MVRYVVTIREGRRPVVTHVFHGDTRAEARGYYRAHLKYDRFLRECVTGNVFSPGGFRCTARARWEED